MAVSKRPTKEGGDQHDIRPQKIHPGHRRRTRRLGTWFSRHRTRPGRAHPARADDGEDRSARLRRHRHGARAQNVPAGAQLHHGGPQGRTVRRRQRRRPGAGAHQVPGTGRKGQDPGHDRSAGRVRGRCDRRPDPPVSDSQPVGGRGRGHDAAQAQSLVRARNVDLGAMRPADGRLLREKARLEARRGDRRRHRLRPGDGRGFPARIRG